MDWFIKGDIQVSECDPAHEILPGLWLGEIAAARSQDWKTKNRITDVLAVIPASVEYTFATKRISILDSSVINIQKYFVSTNRWIHDKLSCNNAKFRQDRQLPPINILVHCFVGRSRSATIVIAYLIEYYDMSFTTALTFVKLKRVCINPNSGFKQQLINFASTLAVDRAFTIIDRIRRRNRQQKKNNYGLKTRRVLRLVWEYGDYQYLSTLSIVAKYIFCL